MIDEQVQLVKSSRLSVCEMAIGDWRDPFIDYMQFGILPDDPKERTSIRRRAPKFYYDVNTKTLYRKSYDGILLRCLSNQEADQVMTETHSGTCGAHQPGPKLCDRIRRMGYYWPTMIKDTHELAK